MVVCNSTGYVYKLKLYGNITGPGGLIKDFSSGEPVNGDTYAQYTANSLGILALGGNNSYQGNTTINAGTILLQSNYALPSTTVLMIDSSNSSTLDMGGYTRRGGRAREWTERRRHHHQFEHRKFFRAFYLDDRRDCH